MVLHAFSLVNQDRSPLPFHGVAQRGSGQVSSFDRVEAKKLQHLKNPGFSALLRPKEEEERKRWEEMGDIGRDYPQSDKVVLPPALQFHVLLQEFIDSLE